MKIIGLTGGIGCGKTTVLKVFSEFGIPCFVADEKAGKYYDDPLFLVKIRELFGDTVFHSNGTVDKARIATIVFNDTDALKKLNALIHPMVLEDFKKWCQQQQTPYVIFESAILYEYGFDKLMDAIITVYLDKEERLRRLELRDHTSREILEARMRNQLSAEEKMDRADYVILNFEGNPRHRQVSYIHQKIMNS